MNNRNLKDLLFDVGNELVGQKVTEADSIVIKSDGAHVHPKTGGHYIIQADNTYVTAPDGRSYDIDQILSALELAGTSKEHGERY